MSILAMCFTFFPFIRFVYYIFYIFVITKMCNMRLHNIYLIFCKKLCGGLDVYFPMIPFHPCPYKHHFFLFKYKKYSIHLVVSYFHKAFHRYNVSIRVLTNESTCNEFTMIAIMIFLIYTQSIIVFLDVFSGKMFF